MNENVKRCDPGACRFCQYIGNGSFLCKKYLEIVITNWHPTENFQRCIEEGENKRRLFCAFLI